MLEKIISGGQTGVDLAALDAAIDLNIAYGGWCPKGRINEMGVISEKYSFLKEISGTFNIDKENYDTRTRCNILDSDATLILVPKIPLPTKIRDGTLLTIQEVQNKKPYLTVDLSRPLSENIDILKNWYEKHNIKILNIAGPRESTCPGIYRDSVDFLIEALPRL